MDSIDCTQRRPSLYAAITLAKLLYNFRDRLRMRIQSKKSCAIKSTILELDTFQSKAHAQIQMYTNHGDNLERFTGHEHLPRALSQIDNQDPSWIVPLCDVARDDRKFLAFDAQQNGRFWRQKQASKILDNTTLLLQYLANLQDDAVARQKASMEHNIYDLAEFDKYLANLEHMTRCLQQVALNALVQNTLDLLASSVSYWHKWLDSAHSVSGDWYSEWSSGRPPLNSTMPWNIKASLVVLWGVCWMFYPTNSTGSSDRTLRSQNPDSDFSTDAQTISTAAAISSPVDDIQALMQHPVDAMPYPSHSGIRSPPTQFGNSSEDQALLIGHYSRGGYASDSVSMTQTGPGLGHMAETGYHDVRFSRQAAPRPELQDYRSNLSTTGIRSPRTASTASPLQGSSDLATPIFVHESGGWQPPLPGEQTISHYGPLSQPGSHGHISSTLAYPSTTPVNSYPRSIANTPPLPGYPQNWDPPNLRPEHYMLASNSGFNSMSGYPLSPNSGPSEREASITSVAPPMRHIKQSPSINNSPTREGRGSPPDPPQDEQGNYYCEHPNCANRSQRFARKCEWKKHRDTHTRPYICRVPGCEKIQGFTYSGGLLRHEREVHQQHGGPINRYFCPFPDCKRSEGQSFSRKENLTEHLRRVHRNKDINTAPIKAEPAPSPTSPDVSIHEQPFSSDSPRKRRRHALSDQDSPQQIPPQLESIINRLRNEINELRQENSELKHQIQMRDARLNSLMGYTQSQ